MNYDFYVKTRDKKHSAEIQQTAFALDYKWNMSNDAISVKHTHAKYLLFRNDKKIQYNETGYDMKDIPIYDNFPIIPDEDPIH